MIVMWSIVLLVIMLVMKSIVLVSLGRITWRQMRGLRS